MDRVDPVLLNRFRWTVKSIIWTPGEATNVPAFGVTLATRLLHARHPLCHPMLMIHPSLTIPHVAVDRITVAWCKKFDVPVEKLFSKTLLQKCTFSLSTISFLHMEPLLLVTRPIFPMIHVLRYDAFRLLSIFLFRSRFSNRFLILSFLQFHGP